MKNALLLLLLATGCSSAPPCSSSTCPGCCDTRGVCQPGSLDTACGVSGTTCATCSTVQKCGLGACVTRLEPRDAGEDAGKDAGPPPVCDPPAQGPFEACRSLADFSWCFRTESAEQLRFARYCPTTAPDALPRRAECDEAVGWLETRGRDSLRSVRECWYVDGGFIGGIIYTDTGTVMAGRRPSSSGCFVYAGCASCDPAPAIGLPCVALTFAGSCASRSSDHELAVCARSPTATRATCGPVESWREGGDECFYEDGGLVGFARTVDDGGSYVGGRWSFSCVPDGGC